MRLFQLHIPINVLDFWYFCEHKSLLNFQDTQFFVTTTNIKSIIKSKMKNIDEVVSKVDIFAQPLEINFEPDRKHGIYLPFVATLALVVIISASTISSLVDLFSYKKVSLTGYRELFAQADSINATIPMIAFKVSIFRDLFATDSPTPFTLKQFSNNFALNIRTHNVDGFTLSRQFSLQPCTRKHWKDISQEEFTNFSVSSYYCPTKLDGFFIASTQLDKPKKDITFEIIQIKPPQLEQLLSLEILLFDQKSVDKQKSAFQNKLKHFFSKSFWKILSVFIEFPYIITNIKDDSTFFPFSSSINKKIATLDLPTYQVRSNNYNGTKSATLFQVNIYMSARSIEYERNVGKVTDIFIETGGLYTSVFGIFSIVVLIYYNHKLRLKLAESTFKNNKNSIKPSDYGFIKSLRYGTRGILKPKENSGFANECKRIEQNLNEVNSLVHIEAILNRLQIIENTLEESQDKDQFVCTSMFQKSSLKKIQRKRLRIEYYSYIVQGKSSITIRDARKMYNGLGMSLEEFLNRRLKHRKQLLIQNVQEKLRLNEAFQTENCIVDPEIVDSQRVQIENLIILKQSKSGLNTLQKVINQFRDIKTQAEQVVMTPEFAEIEVSMAKTFYKMKQKSRAKRQQKIPIIILHRLMKTILHLKINKQERQQKTEQAGDGKPDDIKKSGNKEEQEELSDSSDCFDEDD